MPNRTLQNELPRDWLEGRSDQVQLLDYNSVSRVEGMPANYGVAIGDRIDPIEDSVGNGEKILGV